MKRWLLTILLTLVTMPAWAASGVITTHGTDCSTATNCLVVSLPQDKGGATLTLSGTWTGTIQFEATGDGGATWTAVSVTPLASTTTVTSTTANGTWQVNMSGFTGIRMRSSASMTGSATATITPSAASARNGGGGGGGTVTSVSGTANQIDVATGTTTPVVSLDAAINLPGNITVTSGHTATIASGATLTCAAGSTCPAGGDTITSPNSTLNVGGTAAATTLDLAGAAGEIMAGATPALTYSPTLGAVGHQGTLNIAGSSSGTAAITTQAAAGSPTLTLGTNSGTPSVTASSPLAITTATGNATCTTCATTTSGGALSAVGPMAITSGGAISLQNSTPANVTAAYGTDTNFLTCSGGALTNGDVTEGDANGGCKDSGVLLSALARVGAVTFDSTASGLTTPVGNGTFTFPASTSPNFSLTGTAPASTSSGTGTAGGTMVSGMAAAGGATTGTSTTAGAGQGFAYTTGAGGSGSGGTNASGGAGGNFAITLGGGGAKSGSGTAGVGGAITILPVGGANALTIQASGTNNPQILGYNSDSPSNPTYSWTGNSNTGIFLAASGVIGFSSGGVYRGRFATVGFEASGTLGFGFSDNSSFNDTFMTRISAGNVAFGSSTSGDTSSKVQAAGYISKGTTFTTNAGCSETSLTGGATAGSVASGTSGTCTFVVTMGNTATAAHGWACSVWDLTTTTDSLKETATNGTTVTFSGVTVSGDVINFGCIGY